MRVGYWFVAALLVFGLASGLAIASTPGLRDGPVPPLIWIVAFALVVDLALMPLARAGRIGPITMNERAVGVIGAGIVQTLIAGALPLS
ncbi:hypothetical protein [Salinarimonas soli]|uniref:Uncharacterized protein n=1 Tax=Salinarimonas soli TaxID=1638099 RepID=A0A5B2VA37_9HYPH|nr:hypothetical protein [Salinarimonas soli]KAA2235854.1 hypothetical protein F0L46_17585 [Salinarimonas soli]